MVWPCWWCVCRGQHLQARADANPCHRRVRVSLCVCLLGLRHTLKGANARHVLRACNCAVETVKQENRKTGKQLSKIGVQGLFAPGSVFADPSVSLSALSPNDTHTHTHTHTHRVSANLRVG